MNDLSAESQGFLAVLRRLDDPTPAARERIHRALCERMRRYGLDDLPAPRTVRATCLAAAVVLLACSADSGPDGGRSSTGSPNFANPPSAGTSAGASGGGSSNGAFGNPQMSTAVPANNTAAIRNGDAECATANIRTTRTTPTIHFVIDGSGSMCEPFNGPTRWQALRTALLDPTNGVVYRLQAAAHFGMTLYDGTIDLLAAATGAGAGLGAGSGAGLACAGAYIQNKGMGDCPQLIEVPSALNNAQAIDGAFPQTELGGSTPTDKALATVVDRLIADQVNIPDYDASPQYIILATDGAPNDICVGSMGGDGSAQQQGVLAAVDRAAGARIKTFVISLAGSDPALQAHLDQVASHGDPSNPAAHTFNPATPDELVADIVAIVGGAVGCEIILEGMVKRGSECRGKVEMNGARIPCCQSASCDDVPTDPPDGWLLRDPSRIELVGQTCLDFLSRTEVMIHATFPCDVYLE